MTGLEVGEPGADGESHPQPHLSQDLSGAQAHGPLRKTQAGVGRDKTCSGKQEECQSREFSSSGSCNSLERKAAKG